MMNTLLGECIDYTGYGAFVATKYDTINLNRLFNIQYIQYVLVRIHYHIEVYIVNAAILIHTDNIVQTGVTSPSFVSLVIAFTRYRGLEVRVDTYIW